MNIEIWIIQYHNQLHKCTIWDIPDLFFTKGQLHQTNVWCLAIRLCARGNIIMHDYSSHLVMVFCALFSTLFMWTILCIHQRFIACIHLHQDRKWVSITNPDNLLSWIVIWVRPGYFWGVQLCVAVWRETLMGGNVGEFGELSVICQTKTIHISTYN